MKILAVSDEVVERLYSLCNNGHFNDVELIFGCGDLPYPYLENIVTFLNVPLLYVPGNHDPNYTPEDAKSYVEGGSNLDQKLVRLKTFLIGGLGGCIQYRLDGTNQYTQTDAYLRAFRMLPRLLLNRIHYGRFMDILITHSPPFGIHDDDTHGAGKSHALKSFEDLGYFCVDNLPTTLIPTFAELCAQSSRAIRKIALGVDVREGEYLAHLLETLHTLRETGHRVEVQRFDDSEASRRAVLGRLRANHDPVMLLGVLGGVFAEGLAYPGEMLSQVVVVSPALPQVGPEREMLRDHFADRFGLGFEYAYLIPGMTRVVQAAGRLIRSAEDRGVIVLICRRFLRDQTLVVWAVGAFLAMFFLPLVQGSSQAIWQAKVSPDIQGKGFATRRLIAQISSPVAMILGGRLADVVFEPAMASGGAFAQFFEPLVGSGPGSGMAVFFVFSGIVGVMVALIGYLVPVVRQVETRLPDYDAPGVQST